MKRVLVDQGRAVEVIYPDLYKELNLKLEDLTAYEIGHCDWSSDVCSSDLIGHEAKA